MSKFFFVSLSIILSKEKKMLSKTWLQEVVAIWIL